MPWFKVDDNLHAHPKARRAGLEAIGLWAIAGSHAMDYWNEGFVPQWFVTSWPNGKNLADRLVAAKLWEAGEKDGEEGWHFHEWHERQPSREQYEAKKDATQKRVANWRAKRNGVAQHVAPDVSNSPGNAVTEAVTNDVSNPVSTGSGTGSTSSSVSSTSVSKPRKRGSSPKTEAPKDWKPNERHLELARELNVPTAGLAERFLEWHGARGNMFVNWDLAFMSWIRKTPEFGNSRPNLQSVPSPAHSPWTPEPPPIEIEDDPQACDRWFREQHRLHEQASA